MDKSPSSIENPEASGAPIVPPGGTGSAPERIQEWATRIGAVAAALAGLVIVVHLLGGVVMWLRFRKAGLPADQAVALMTREQMLAIGLRLIVLPVIIAGGVALTLVWAQAQRVRGGRWERALRPLQITAAVVTLALIAGLPGSWASFTWLALLLVILYWWRGFGVAPRAADPSSWRLAVVAVLAAALISLGRQVDEPVQLLSVTLAVDKQPQPVQGVFVSADSTAVYVGDTTTKALRAFRRDDVRSIELGPPIERAPNRSLLSWAFWSTRWAITPLRWWCNGQEYDWRHVGELCRTQPRVVADQRRALDIGWLPVRISCPASADDGCDGYMRLRTAATYGKALGPAALPQQVWFPRQSRPAIAIHLPSGRTREVCVPVDVQERALLRAAPEGRSAAERPVRLEAILSSDPEGKSEMARDPYALDVLPGGSDPSLIPRSGCSAQERKAAKPWKATKATADGVINGNTIYVRRNGRRAIVRLLGIEAPQAPAFGAFACGQRQGSDALLRLLFSAPGDGDGDGLMDTAGGAPANLLLASDPALADRDADSRLLRHVLIEGRPRTLSERIAEAGWARPDPANRRALAHVAGIEQAAEAARAAQRGLSVAC